MIDIIFGGVRLRGSVPILHFNDSSAMCRTAE